MNPTASHPQEWTEDTEVVLCAMCRRDRYCLRIVSWPPTKCLLSFPLLCRWRCVLERDQTNLSIILWISFCACNKFLLREFLFSSAVLTSCCGIQNYRSYQACSYAATIYSNSLHLLYYYYICWNSSRASSTEVAMLLPKDHMPSAGSFHPILEGPCEKASTVQVLFPLCPTLL